MSQPFILTGEGALIDLTCEDAAIVALTLVSLKNAPPSWRDKLYDDMPEEERFFGDSISHSRTLVPAN